MTQYRTVELADGRWRLERWEPRRRTWAFAGHFASRRESTRWIREEATRRGTVRVDTLPLPMGVRG